MFSTKFATLFTALVVAASAVSAATSVVRPRIVVPAKGDTWRIGTTQLVAWDTTEIPKGSENQTALLLLGFIEDGSDDEHLDLDHPLATDVPFSAGFVDVVVPNVTPRDNYVVFVGDTGNPSGKFSIKN